MGMNIDIKYGEKTDFGWLKSVDIHVEDDDWIKRCLQNQEYLIACRNNNYLGFLRYSLFWGSIPYMDMIRINEDVQKSGIGTKLISFWEQEMKRKSAKMCMTSSQIDEPEPMTWHLRNGYRPSGQIDFWPTGDPSEIFMIKEL